MCLNTSERAVGARIVYFLLKEAGELCFICQELNYHWKILKQSVKKISSVQ